MSNIEKVRQQIEMLYDGEAPKHDQQCDFDDGYFTGLSTIENFIDLLPEEKPSKDLEEEVKRYYSDNFTYISSDQPTLSILTNVARHFAEWQKERMIKDAKEIITIQRSLTEPEFVKQRVIFLKEG